jgi:DNA-binding transcriptional ArsR family regulator
MKLNPSVDICATKLAVLADPTRLAVLEVLRAGPSNVKEINQHLQLPQNLLSHHLKVLRDAGLVTSSRDGKAVRYELAEGVDLGRKTNGINLGCCSLTFPASELGKK